MSFTVVIPARFAATRLPGKMLKDIHGKPMIWHVYQKAMAAHPNQVIIATDDERIESVAKRHELKCIMTSEAHTCGTNRIEEVASMLQLPDDEIIVNVQGDEPLIDPAHIQLVAENLASTSWSHIATLAERCHNQDYLTDPSKVKVVLDKLGRALYFSRSPIPHGPCTVFYRHHGIYAYRVQFLQQFVKLPTSDLENLEKLEQLRALENGFAIHVGLVNKSESIGVDTQADLDYVRDVVSRTD